MPSSFQNTIKDLYNIDYWSDGFFDINNEGELVAYPTRQRELLPLRLVDLIKDLAKQGLHLPVLVRFNDILHQRVSDLCRAFQQAMQTYNYANNYTPVYPIKVNQQRRVIAQLLETSNVGLEAGSKPELMAVLGLSSQADALILCNGYKDREYIRLALMGLKWSHRVFIIVEKTSEIELVLEEAAKLKVQPLLGLRVRLAAMGSGKWQNTGGERGKFGLSAAQVLQVIERLRQADQLNTVQLLHFHMGSQVANIRDIQKVVQEAARYYAELCQLNVPLKYLDVGGGLGVDYEGTRSRSDCSINYNIQEYANNIVHAFAEMCVATKQPHPHIITESGRAMTAHHAVLITDVIDYESVSEEKNIPVVEVHDPTVLRELANALQAITKRPLVEIYHDAQHHVSEVQALYNHGLLSLAQRAKAEQLYTVICCQVLEGLRQNPHPTHLSLLNELNEKLADKYFCNFSVFQSVPDVWGIDQIFPVMPLTGLNALPTRRVTLHDLTCDSDGQIKQYVDGQGIESTLPLPAFNPKEPYFLGIFLVGAYQEILGDMHNLFGDTHSVHVTLQPNGQYTLEYPLHGDRVADVLRYVHINPEELLSSYQQKMARSDLADDEKQALLEELQAGLQGYTYLEA